MVLTRFGGKFILDLRFKAVFVAGGIGITAFRSMLKQVIDDKLPAEITLIYLNHTSDFPFRDELNKWQVSNPNIKIHFVITKGDRSIGYKAFQRIMQPLGSQVVFYLAGSPGMVDSYKNILHGLGVRKNQIKIDSFKGY